VKGLILAGGKGTRLRPITHTSAKQLVPIANQPILVYGLAHMAAAGITDVGVVIGDTGDEVRRVVGDGSAWGVEVTYIPQEEPLGLAHCVLIAGDFLGDDEFVMYLGDNMLEHGLGPLVGDGVPPAAAHILLPPVRDPPRFGVAEVDDEGRVVRLVEKPEEPASDLAMVGVYRFTPAIHEAVRSIEPSARGELEIVDALQWLIDRGDVVHHQRLDGWWLDTGKKDSLLEANRRVLESVTPAVEGEVDEASVVDGRVVLEAGATLVGTTVRGPAVIGAGATLVDSYVGPFTSIGPGSRIERSGI
jgi:glucose-1-phosphate thymidylyltransferase